MAMRDFLHWANWDWKSFQLYLGSTSSCWRPRLDKKEGAASPLSASWLGTKLAAASGSCPCAFQTTVGPTLKLWTKTQPCSLVFCQYFVLVTVNVTNRKVLLEHKMSETPQQDKLPILEKRLSVARWKIQDDLGCGCAENYLPSWKQNWHTILDCFLWLW